MEREREFTNWSSKVRQRERERDITPLDLANGSGQSGSGSTHAGSGQKTGRPKWVAHPITLTRSFKGQVKTGLTRIFIHEKIYIYKMKINLIL